MMSKEQIYAYLRHDLDRVREVISSALASGIGLLDSTNESILSHPGKMMRPALALLAAKVCSGGRLAEDSYRCAAAVELLHNATLLHDDVADNSSSRRGRPTVMKMLGGGAAVLLGDYWLVRAMDVIFSLDRHREATMKVFSKTLGDLARGEMIQLEKSQSACTTEEDYFRIIYCKTASLFEAAALGGAFSVDASEGMRSAVCGYAVNLGIAFQIKDDIFDYQKDADVGKPVGHDILERKITLPLLCALSQADAGRRREIREMVLRVSGERGSVPYILDFVAENGGVEAAGLVLDGYVEKARESLSVFPAGDVRDMLESLAEYTAARST